MLRVEFEVKWALKAWLWRDSAHEGLANRECVVRRHHSLVQLRVNRDVVAISDSHLKRVSSLSRGRVSDVLERY